MHKLLEWLPTGWIGRPLKVLGWISQRNRLAQHKLLRYAEHAFGLGRGGPRDTGTREVTNCRAYALGSCREQDPLRQTAFVIRVEVRNLRVDDNGDAHGS